MCLRPILIDNPYLGLADKGYNYLKDTTSKKIPVPCGHCSQCVAMKQSYIVQRSQMESHENDLWFCTLTYKTSMLPVMEVNGYKLRYAEVSDLQNMMKRLRASDALGLPFKYWAVTEYGGKKHRPHFHVILSTPKIPGESRAQKLAREKEYYNIIFNEWRRNVAKCYNKEGKLVANTRCPEYKSLCDLHKSYKNGKVRSTYDFHWIDPSVTDSKGKIHDESDVAFYVTKYTVKANKYVDRLKSALRLNLTPEDFWHVWPILRPKCLVSKTWGSPDSDYVKNHIREGIDRALNDVASKFPYFINPSTGQTFPLAPFYKKRFLTLVDAHDFFYRHTAESLAEDGFAFMSERDPIVEAQRDMKFIRMKDIINARESEDPYYTYIYNSDYETEETDSDYLIDSYLNHESMLNMLYDSAPVDGFAEYYDRNLDFLETDFD